MVQSQNREMELLPCQDVFLFSKFRYPIFIAGVGTGKTFILLLKAWQFCEQYPESNALIVRLEYTDLRDSTIRDFEHYFGVKIDSEKNYRFENGSVLMFRHGSELNVLKNMNLSWVGIEQGEEFETADTFDFLRDRLRRGTSPYRQMCVIANAKGHNWLYRRGITGATVRVLDEATGQYVYEQGDYQCVTGSSFANQKNLPKDFIADLRKMELEAPNHYKRFILNSFEELEESDMLFSYAELEACRRERLSTHQGYGNRICGYDIARYGDDKCAAVGLEQAGALRWKECHVEQWAKADLDYTTGRILSIHSTIGSGLSVVDEDGIGSGPLDTLNHGQGRQDFVGFRNPVVGYKDDPWYGNRRTKGAYELKGMVAKGNIWVGNEELIQELLTLRFKYLNDGRRILLSKDEMRKKGYKSPNLADALIMAVSIIPQAMQMTNQTDVREHAGNIRQPTTYREDNLFSTAGVR